jgi:hypothetical protein
LEEAFDVRPHSSLFPLILPFDDLKHFYAVAFMA